MNIFKVQKTEIILVQHMFYVCGHIGAYIL